jgi:hypothetical protein
MKRAILFAFALLVAGLLCVVQQPRAQLGMSGVGGGGFGGAAAAPFGLDGVANGSGPATLTTAYRDVIIYVVTFSGAGGLHVTSVSDTAGNTWANRAAVPQSGPNAIEVWYAKASGPLSSDVITPTFSGAASSQASIAFGVSCANLSTPFDSNGSLPNTIANLATAATISTSNANDFIYGFYVFAGTATPTAGSGFTLISNVGSFGYMMTEYQIVTSTQSGLAVSVGTGAGDTKSGGGDAT